MIPLLLVAVVAASAAAQDPASDARWVQVPRPTADVIACAKYSDVVISPESDLRA